MSDTPQQGTASPPFVLSQMGARLQERTAPLAPDDAFNGWAHALLCEAMGMMLSQAAEVWDPPDDMLPGGPLVAVDACPDWALPWLAQMVGIVLPGGATPDQMRDFITSVGGWNRGNPSAMRAAAAQHLTGTQTVWFRERNGSAYRLEVITITSETPDPAAVLAALTRQKPAGIVLAYRTVTSWDYEQMTTDYPGAYTTLKTAYPSTYYKLTNKEPG